MGQTGEFAASSLIVRQAATINQGIKLLLRSLYARLRFSLISCS